MRERGEIISNNERDGRQIRVRGKKNKKILEKKERENNNTSDDRNKIVRDKRDQRKNHC